MCHLWQSYNSYLLCHFHYSALGVIYYTECLLIHLNSTYSQKFKSTHHGCENCVIFDSFQHFFLLIKRLNNYISIVASGEIYTHRFVCMHTPTEVFCCHRFYKFSAVKHGGGRIMQRDSVKESWRRNFSTWPQMNRQLKFA